MGITGEVGKLGERVKAFFSFSGNLCLTSTVYLHLSVSFVPL